MNHRPFEGWLLENQPLTSEQKHEMQAHLRECAACTALAEVDLALRRVTAASPAAGFADRFRVRLEAQMESQRKRQFWGFFILVISVLAVLIWFAWPLLALFVQSPANLLASWLSSLASLWAALRTISEAGSVLWRVMPGLVPAYMWILVILAAAGWSLIWVFSLQKFAKVPQGA